MIGIAILALLGLILLLLLWPVCYVISLERWRLGVRISLLSGLWAKEIVLPEPKEEERTEEVPAKENPIEEAPKPIEKEKPMEMEDILAAAEEAGKEDSREMEESGGEIDEDEDGPSVWQQIRFAIHNGLAERAFAALGALLSHSFPKHLRMSGEFGSGDPMTTGIACGLATALAGDAGEKILWNYLEPVNTLQGRLSGRIIPIVVLYIAGRLILSKPFFEFMDYRKEGA